VTDIATSAATITATIGAVASATWLARRAGRFLRTAVHAFDDIVGSGDKPGLIDRIETLHDRLKAVEHELHPNSQLSLRDAIDRIEREQQQYREVVDRMATRLDELKHAAEPAG
jgi:hypothetical protein